jgi:hypothetical protein
MLKSNDLSKVIKSLHDEDERFLKQIGVLLYLGYQDIDESKQEFLEDVIEEGERRLGRHVDVTVTRRNSTVTIDYKPSGTSKPAEAD